LALRGFTPNVSTFSIFGISTFSGNFVVLLSRTDFSRTRTRTWGPRTRTRTWTCGPRTRTRTQITNVEAPVK